MTSNTSNAEKQTPWMNEWMDEWLRVALLCFAIVKSYLLALYLQISVSGYRSIHYNSDMYVERQDGVHALGTRGSWGMNCVNCYESTWFSACGQLFTIFQFCFSSLLAFDASVGNTIFSCWNWKEENWKKEKWNRCMMSLCCAVQYISVHELA